MSWNGSGTFNRTDGTRSGTQVWQDARDAGVNIRADDHDTHDQDIADGLENTVALDGQNTTTTDNAILRYDQGNSQFEGVTVSASQIVGRSASGDTRGMSAATARQTIEVPNFATVAATNGTILQYSSASSQYEERPGVGTAAPSNHHILQYSSAASTYQPVNGLPPGIVQMWAGSSEPNGWLFCSGQAVSRTTYAALFNEIGTTFGNGDGSTTFNVPDLRDRSPLGENTMGASDANRVTNTSTGLGNSGGADQHTLSNAEMPSHNHGGGTGNASSNSLPRTDTSGSGSASGFAFDDGGPNAPLSNYNLSGHNHSISTSGSDNAHNNMHPFLALNFIIKT